MKILNLYACLGGNRYKWDEVTDVEVTAVEWDEELAKLYQERFPNDTVVVADLTLYGVVHLVQVIVEQDIGTAVITTLKQNPSTQI